MRLKSCLNFSCLALLVLLALSGWAFSEETNIVVGATNCLGNYPVVPTINQALLAVKGAKHAVIYVCPGIYSEQVVISQALTLKGYDANSEAAAVIVPPASGVVANTADLDTGLAIAAQVLVQNTTGPVTITNLTIDGTGNGIADCNTDLQGIRFENGSGTVNYVVTQNQIPGGIFGSCATGEGMVAQASSGNSVVTFEDSSIVNYNKNGITVSDPNSKATITGNFVQGAGAAALAVQNGIQLGYGAKGSISVNNVNDNNNAGPPYAADILLIDAAENGGISVNSNILGNSQLPLGLETDFADAGEYGDGVLVTSNKIYGASTYDGIDVCTNGNTVTNNFIANSVESGVHLDASCGTNYGGGTLFTGNSNTLSKNTILGGSCAGILQDTGTTDSIGAENYYAVPFTVTSSTSSCTIPARLAQARSKAKFSPKR